MPACLLKRTPAQAFSCANSEIFKNIYFEKYLRTAASDNSFTLVIYLFFGCLFTIIKKNYHGEENVH